jgi:putative aldouronate transport system substrate-binding protein
MKDMSRTKFAVSLIALCVLFGAVAMNAAAEGRSEASATPLTIVLPGDRPQEMDKVGAALEKAAAKDLGPVKLSFEFYAFDQFGQKVALKAAAKEPMDLVFDPFWLNFYQMQSQGAFLPLDEIIKKLSFYGKPGNVATPVWKAVSVNGKIYGLPALENNYVTRAESTRNIVRKDLYDKFAPQGITTGPQMLEFIKKVHENAPQYLMINAVPEEVGVLSTPAAPLLGKKGMWDALWAPAGDSLLNLYTDVSVATDAAHAPRVFSGDFTPEYENEVAAGIELQKMGLISSESVPDKRAAFISGRLGMFGGDKDDYANTVYPAVKDTFGCVWVRTDVKAKGVLERATGNWFCVSASSKTPEKAAQFVDWIVSSRDNYELWAYGIKGDHFTVNAKGAIEKINPEKRRYEMLWWYVFNRRDLRQDFSATPDAQKYLDWANKDSNSYPNPLIGFAFDPEPVKTEIAQVKAVRSEYTNLLLGLAETSKIQEFRDKLMKAGVQKIIDEMNNQIAVWWKGAL